MTIAQKKNTYGWLRMSRALVQRRDLSELEKYILAYIGHWERQALECFVGQDTLCEELGCSERSVQRATKHLRDLELLDVTARNHAAKSNTQRTNVYTLTAQGALLYKGGSRQQLAVAHPPVVGGSPSRQQLAVPEGRHASHAFQRTERTRKEREAQRPTGSAGTSGSLRSPEVSLSPAAPSGTSGSASPRKDSRKTRACTMHTSEAQAVAARYAELAETLYGLRLPVPFSPKRLEDASWLVEAAGSLSQALEATEYLVRESDVIQARYRLPERVRDLGFFRRFDSELARVEAWAKDRPTIAAWEAWFSEHPNDYPPADLERAYKAAKARTKLASFG